MKRYSMQSAITVFYYLMAIDGEIGSDEMDCFNEIGMGLDRVNYPAYRDTLVEKCIKQISFINEEADYSEILQESIDAVLSKETPDNNAGITPRLLIWDLLAVAFSNGKYDTAEKKLIAHVARTIGVEKDVFLEMEQMMQTAAAVREEKKILQNMNRPYTEIRPMVDELDKRLSVILTSGKTLIDDEVVLDEPYLCEPGFLDKTKAALEDTIGPVAHKIGEKTKGTTADAIQKIAPAAKQIKEGTSGLLKKLINKTPNTKDTQKKEEE